MLKFNQLKCLQLQFSSTEFKLTLVFSWSSHQCLELNFPSIFIAEISANLATFTAEVLWKIRRRCLTSTRPMPTASLPDSVRGGFVVWPSPSDNSGERDSNDPAEKKKIWKYFWLSFNSNVMWILPVFHFNDNKNLKNVSTIFS